MAKSNRKATDAKHKTTETNHKALSIQPRRRRPPPPEHPQHRKESSRKGDYEIGYGKPPVRNQFKPGQSGNPNGRPKGRKNSATRLDEILNQVIELRENGKVIKLTKEHAMYMSQVAKAIGGSTPAFREIRELRQKLLPDDKPDNGSAEVLSEEDRAILDALIFHRDNHKPDGGKK